jgi:hypothetical protein
MSQLFMIASIDPQPSANFPLAIDNIVWDCGSDAACQSNGSSSSVASSIASSVSSTSSVVSSSSSSSTGTVSSSSSVAVSSASSSSLSSSSSSANVGFDWLIQAENFAATSGVAVVDTSDIGGGKHVANVGAGNWMAFTGLNVPSSGVYQIEYRVASPSATQFSSDLNGGTIQLGTVNVPATGGSHVWSTITQTVNLNAGSYSFGIYAKQGGWSLNWFRITKVSGSSSSASSSSVSSSVASSSSSSAASSSASSTSSAYGYTVLTNDSVKFYANNALWVDIHYTVNNGGQQNIRMLHNLDNTNTYALTGIPAGAVVKYFFTIGPLVNGAFDTPWQSFTLNAAPMVCDFNGSNTVNLDDIDMILARKNTIVQGSSPYDINKDGVINLLDARACVLKCTKTACAR